MIDMLAPAKDLCFQEMILHKVKQCCEYKLNVECYSDPYLIETIILRITSEMFGHSEDYEEEVSFEVPDGWFQAFKKSVFPNWILKHFPIKYKTLSKSVIVTAHMLFPDVQVHDQTTIIRWLKQ